MMKLGLFTKPGKITSRWTFDAGSGAVAAATVAELRRGESSVVLGTKDGRVICLSHEGKERWTFRANEQLSEEESYFVDEERVHSIDAPPVIADVNRDGNGEIIVGTELGTVYCLSHEGKLLWSHLCKGGIRAGAMVADINMDGMPEIVMGCLDGSLTALSGKGEVLFRYTGSTPIEATACLGKTPKQAMIIVGNNKGKVLAISASGELLWETQLDGRVTATPSLVASGKQILILVGTENGALYCLTEQGEIMWKYVTDGSIYNSVVLADLDDDGNLEIVFGSCDNCVHALSLDGKHMWSYETDFWVAGKPSVSDVNGDDQLEVVAGSFDHGVYVLDARGEFMLDYVPGIAGIINQAGHYSNILTSEPGEQTGKLIEKVKLDGVVLGCSLLPHDKNPLIIATTKEGRVTALQYARQ